MLRRRPVLLWLPLAAGAGPAAAQAVRRGAGSLAGQTSTFAPVAAPDSALGPTGPDSAVRSRAPDSTFAPVQGPDTDFRLAEVPPERRVAARGLLTELHARQDTARAIVVDLPADVLFDFDHADLRADARPALARAAELLRSYPEAPVAIHGHTDARGSEAYNEALSLRRAQAVAAALEPAAGGRRLAVQGHGKREPVAPEVGADGSDSPEGRQRNRRVAIVIAAVPR